MPSGKRCFCLSRGWELSSLPRPRIPGTFANGSGFRLAENVSRTWKCSAIRTETDIVLAADDQAHLTGHRAPWAMPPRLNGKRSRHSVLLRPSTRLFNVQPYHHGLDWFPP